LCSFDAVVFDFRLTEVKFDEAEKISQKVSHPNSKKAFLRSSFQSHYLNQYRPIDQRFTICKEILLALPVVIYTKKDFFLIGELDRKLSDLMAAGLIDHWSFKALRKQKNERKNGPKMLTMKKLAGCFHILFCGLAISFVAFVFEYGIGNKLKRQII
jgi:hypothetical protein